MTALKSYLNEKFQLASDATDEAAKTLASDKIKSGELTLDKYTELLAAPAPKDKAAELADTIATKTASATATALAPVLGQLAEVLKARSTPPEPKTEDDDDRDLKAWQKEQTDRLAAMEKALKERHGLDQPGTDGAALMKMALDFSKETPDTIRVKSAVERFSHTPTALTYTKSRSKLLGLHGQSMQYNGQEVNKSTDRTKAMSAAWLKFQVFPEGLSEQEADIIRYILHREKFHYPNSQGDTHARLLTEAERHEVWTAHKNFYVGGQKATVLIGDTTSGGSYATPEFFDMDMIVTPTLASEDIPSYCHIVPVPRGAAAQNFTLGRPTIAAHTEGTGVTLFTTDSLIGNHDTTFFRAMGGMQLGLNLVADAHPGLVPELQNQYLNSYRLWLNEQITGGDGTTEPQGIMVASGTNNVTPTTPTTGPIVLADILEMLFAVGKAYREDGGRGNAIFIMTDVTYSRIRAIATGVTGDTRLVFGEDVESYMLFGHPVLIEEVSTSNDEMIFCQMKGYRLYLRQGPRFFREDRGDTLVRANAMLIGMDCRVGGQLDLGGYAAVATGFMT